MQLRYGDKHTLWRDGVVPIHSRQVTLQLFQLTAIELHLHLVVEVPEEQGGRGDGEGRGGGGGGDRGDYSYPQPAVYVLCRSTVLMLQCCWELLCPLGNLSMVQLLEGEWKRQYLCCTMQYCVCPHKATCMADCGSSVATSVFSCFRKLTL